MFLKDTIILMKRLVFAEELDKEKEFGYIKIEKIDEPKLKKKCTIS